jgi:hypothetical protein
MTQKVLCDRLFFCRGFGCLNSTIWIEYNFMRISCLDVEILFNRNLRLTQAFDTTNFHVPHVTFYITFYVTFYVPFYVPYL